MDLDPKRIETVLGGIVSIERRHSGPRMSQSVVHDGICYLAGQVAQEARGKPVADQTRAILARIDELLGEVGASKSTALSAQIWLADIDTFAEMNAVWDAWIDPDNPPARACVEARLASPDFTVEIMVTAAV